MTEKLFNDFPPVTTQQWEDQIVKDLKGADYEKKLVWTTPDGTKVRPYYREEDLEGLPYRMRTKNDNNWLIRQTFPVQEDLSVTNTLVLDALNRGVESVGFRMKEDRVLSPEEMARLLDGVHVAVVELSFEGLTCARPGTFHSFIAWLDSLGAEAREVQARFSFDPVGDAFFKETQCTQESLTTLAALVKAARTYKGIRLVDIPGYKWQNGGSGVVQELACSAALAQEYREVLTAGGLSEEEAAHTIHFHMGIGLHYFLEMAKFRAARILWDEYTKQDISLHAVTSFWDQTAYDMYVNLLRGTTGAMSAAIAGVDSMEVLPFDSVLTDGTEQSSRLARNIQIILKEEAGFNKVADPAAGSYYIENLTVSVLEEAKKMADEILAKGGFRKSGASGWVREQIRDTRERRSQRLASGRQVMVGINKYPDPLGKAPEGLYDLPEEKWERASAPFEKMRLKTEQAEKVPVVFLLTFGNLALCRARAQFASNFFGVAGFKVVDNNRFTTVQAGVEAARASGADIVVACSSDEEYARAVPEIFNALGKQAIVTVAGEPACKEDLMAAGVTHFISVRSNLLETLLTYQKELGI
ncbi:MAG: methylmalonyl-CoA mutase family protein [Bacteroidales bacterium]|jgi:methylmalonyl-CoA mutase